MSRLRWVLVLTVTALSFAVLLTAYGFELARIARLSALVDRRMDEIVRLSRRMQVLREEIAYYETSEGVARLAREQFNLAYPDELVFRIVYTSEDHMRILSEDKR